MSVSLADMKAKLTITAGVTGGELLDKFGGKLNTVGKTADVVNKQMASLDQTVRTLAAGFGAAKFASFIADAARATIQLDAYAKQLRVSFGGTASFELDKIRDTMRQLGIAQDEALGSAVRFTSALKLSGQSAQQANQAFADASKLILSNKLSADGANRVYYAMAQIASKGKLMSEELNGQLGDVLAGFTQQVAAAMSMSTAQLAKAMQDGKVSAEQFFEALNKIGGGIDPAELDSAAMALGRVKNAAFDFKASLLQTSEIKDALDALATSIRFLGDNSSAIMTVISVGLIAALSRYTVSSVAATAATIQNSAANRAALLAAVQQATATRAKAVEELRAAQTTLALARSNFALGTSASVAAGEMRLAAASVAQANAALLSAQRAAVAGGAGLNIFQRAGAGAMALFGGPWGVALAVAAASVTAYSSVTAEAKDRMDANIASAKALGAALTVESRWAEVAAEANKNVGLGAAGAEPAIWSFKNATDGLTKSLWEQAKAARAARVEFLQKQADENKKRMADAEWYTTKGSEKNYSEGAKAFGRGNVLGGLSGIGQGLGSDIMNILTGGEAGRNSKRDIAQARANYFAAQGQLDILKGAPIGKSDLPAGVGAPVPAPSGGSKKKGGSGQKGPTAVQIEKSYQDMLNSITQEEVRSRQELITTVEERYQSERESLASEISEKRTTLKAAKNFTTAQYRLVDQAINDLEASKMAAIEARRQDGLLKERNEITRTDLEGQVEMKRLQLDVTNSAGDRRRISQDILDLETQIERNKLEEVVATSTSSATEIEIARRKLAQLDEQTEIKKKKIERDNEGPLKAKMRELRQNTDDINTALENVGAKGLQSLEDGLIGVLDGTKSVADAFRDMANQIIADLLRIAVQKFIVSTIGGLFAEGGAFSGGTQMFANGGAFSGGTEFFATGGAFTNTIVTRPTAFGMANGKTGVMGEAGPEAIVPLRRTSSGRLGVEVVAPRGQRGDSRPMQVAVAVPGNERVASAISNMGSRLVAALADLPRSTVMASTRSSAVTNVFSSQTAPILYQSLKDDARSDMISPSTATAPARPGAVNPEKPAPMRSLRTTGVGSKISAPQNNNVNVTVNVEGGNQKVDGNSENANQLGRVIANVVRQELVNQQRPGGLLSR